MDVLSDIELRNDYRKYFTLSTVCLGHLLVLYVIWSADVQVPIATAVPKNTINIRFIAPQKNDVRPVADLSSGQFALKNTQKTVEPTTALEVSKKQESNVSVISTDTLRKTVIPIQKNASKQQAQQNSTVQVEKEAVKTKDNPEKNVQMFESSMSTSTATKSTGSTASESKASVQNSEHQSESSAVSTASDKVPIPINRVDVLSLGKLTYDDRELQNQQRLVVLTIHINAKGLPVNIHVKQSSGLESLDERAMAAIRKSKFKPHKMNGEAVAVIVDFPIQLKLSRNR
ncbi:TonB family protein [Acinetobacter chinensis]|uniref:TonB family protein n=1 Tax=Acinetobacter chinensis TaxID=2004650 RepID=A0ABU3WBT3_9GAMM|nr:TonB family protein [Acinetobacter chinensis]MDV2467869.1 TonB family protein [Acinetobacter chinensis]